MDSILGNEKKPLIICEVGSAHEGSLELCKEMLYAITECGVETVKFQIYRPEELIHPILLTDLFGRITHLQFTADQWLEIFELCNKLQLDFSASVFGNWGLNLVKNCDWIKIASGDLTHLQLLRKVGYFKKKVLLSTGMGTLGEILVALINIGHKDVTLLHCMSLYPCPSELAHLEFISKLRQEFDLPVGYSDHCIGIETAIKSLDYCPEVIEKHFTLTPKAEGGDHQHAATPEMLIELKKAVLSKQNGFNNRPDKVNQGKWRRGIYPRDINKTITEANVTIVRPEEGSPFPANELYEIIGKTFSEISS